MVEENFYPEQNIQSIQKSSNKKWVLISLVGLFVVVLIIVLMVFLIFFLNKDIKISDSEISKGKYVEVKEEQKVLFNMEGGEHFITINSISGNSVRITIQSRTIKDTLDVGEEKKFDLNDDGVYDLSVELVKILDGKVKILVRGIMESVCEIDWDCGDWTVCSEEENQTRVCIDLNDCGTNEGRPVEIMGCGGEDVDCYGNDECDERYICDENNHQCIEGTRCTSNNNCGNDEYCKYRSCLPKIEEWGECIPSYGGSCLNDFVCVKNICIPSNYYDQFEDCSMIDENACDQLCNNCVINKFQCALVNYFSPDIRYSGVNCVECYVNSHCKEGYKCHLYECVIE